MKNVLIINTSMRKNGNSMLLALAFKKGAEENNNVEVIDLYDKSISFCKGCLSCRKIKKCIIDDDANMIVNKMLNADVIVFSTPIYYYEMSGQMKTLLDRANPLYYCEYKFRDIYLLASAADEELSAIDGAINGLSGWISCFDGVRLSGKLLANGVEDIGDVVGRKVLEEAYEMGKAI